MTRPAHTFLPLCLLGLCLIAVFFVEFDRHATLGRDGRRRYLVHTRFTILPALLPDAAAAKNGEWLHAQMQILSSRELFLSIVSRLNLEQDWKMSPDAAIARLRKMLTCKLEPGSSIVSLTAKGSDLDETTDIVDAVRDSYEEYRNNEALETARRLALNPAARDAARRVKTIELLEKTGEIKPGNN